MDTNPSMDLCTLFIPWLWTKCNCMHEQNYFPALELLPKWRTGININASTETILPPPFLTAFCGSFNNHEPSVSVFSPRTLIDTVFSHYCTSVAGHILKKYLFFGKQVCESHLNLGVLPTKPHTILALDSPEWQLDRPLGLLPHRQRWAQERRAGGRARVCPRCLWGRDPRPGGDGWDRSPGAAAAAGPGGRFRTP